jgi:nucleotide-binding universal stress UspA family protein
MTGRETFPVIVGVDGSPGSAGALRYAFTEARRRHAPLQLVHAVPSYLPAGPRVPVVGLSEFDRVGRSILKQQEEVVRGWDPDLDVRTVLAHGDRAATLIEASERGQLVVVGRETRRGLDRLLTGTTTASVAAHADCDVVVVPSFWVDDVARGQVVVGIKSSRNVHELLSQAFAEAAARGATLKAVTAWQLPDPYFDRVEARTHAEEWEAEGTKVLDEVLVHWRSAYPQVRVETRVVHGAPARVLLHAGSESDLIVVSRRRLAIPPYGHLGGVVHALLRVSDVPVVVVPYVADAAVAPDPLDDLVLETDGAPVK